MAKKVKRTLEGFEARVYELYKRYRKLLRTTNDPSVRKELYDEGDKCFHATMLAHSFVHGLLDKPKEKTPKRTLENFKTRVDELTNEWHNIMESVREDGDKLIHKKAVGTWSEYFATQCLITYFREGWLDEDRTW